MENQVYRILVVDDEPDLHDLFKKRFRELVKQGTHIFEFASNGQEALDLIKSEKIFHLLFTDISMPVMDGWEFLEEYALLKPKIDKQITIYIITSSVSPEDILRAKKNKEVTDYLIKPITKDNFIALLKKL